VEEIRARDNLSNSPTMKLVFDLAKFLLFSVTESIITFIPEDNVVLEDLAPIGHTMEPWHRDTGAGLRVGGVQGLPTVQKLRSRGSVDNCTKGVVQTGLITV
jgi:hypothetical protein